MPELSALRHIEMDFSDTNQCNISLVLRLLKKAPNVEYLHVTPLYARIEPGGHPIISMKRLRHVDIKLISPEGANVFEYLVVPNSCKLVIHCFYGGVSANSGQLFNLQVLNDRAQLSGIRRAIVLFLERGVLKLDLYIEGQQASIFTLVQPFRSSEDNTLSLSSLASIPTVDIAFVGCADMFQSYLRSIAPDVHINLMIVKDIGFSYCCYCWEANRDALFGFMRLHGSLVKKLGMSKCTMSRAFLRELRCFTQVSTDGGVQFVTDRPDGT
ncbi:hypothetical protein ONZ45_g13111 [Pleurotus djamor]|nr:hypothetical protein ONZ45_g13111 [Pleurotus djamor]